MAWLLLQIPVVRAEVAAVEAAFQAAGAEALLERAAGTTELLEPDPGATPLWDTVVVEALFPLVADLAPLMQQLRQSLAPAWRAALEVAFLEEADWQSRYRAHAVRACFGDRLWLLPRDEDSPARPDQRVLRLDPGLAFGTGGHPTTWLCLEWLATHGDRLAGRTLLDFGCGSGVLALAALTLDAAAVTAVDHDPQAVAATHDNAERSGLADGRLTVRDTFDRAAQPPFAVIVANILANPLIELAPLLSAALEPGGDLVLSGILPEQAPAVREAYPAVDFAPVKERNGWVLLTGRKRDHV